MSEPNWYKCIIRTWSRYNSVTCTFTTHL